uniref:Biogenesis of lysosome-related organelles complex 1 subunit 7 n=1 Tax=Hucho hucho TaxID=62062 RepID=A0A4W5QWD2_9TELE
MAALAVVETPSGKDAIAEGLLGLLKPAVQQLDLHVHSVRFVELVPACLVHVAGHRVIGVRSADMLQYELSAWESQVELREHIDNLATELCRINEHQKVVLDLDPYVKKLLNARRRVVLVNNILQNAQERLRRLNHNVAKETARRKTMLETSGAFTPRSPSKP